jgi:hypothetical protein
LIEVFTANIRNRNTRMAYARAVKQFFDWCDNRKMELEGIDPLSVAAYIEQLGVTASKPCPSSKLNRREFIGGFDLLAIACIHGDVDKRSGSGRPKRTPNPHRAGAGIDRAAPSNCSAGAQPKSSPVLPSF